MISRIDLRGDALPEGPALRDLLPRADFDVEAALEKVRPICEDVHHRGDAALIDYAEKFDGVAARAGPGPRRGPHRAPWSELDPAVRAALEESIRRARIVHREQRRTDAHHPGRARRHGHREVGAGRARRAVRARRPVRLPVLRGHERRPGAGGRRRVASPLASPAAGRVRRAAAPDDPRRLRAARRRRGVRGGRRPAVAMFAYGTESCAARQHGHRPRQHLGRRRQAATSRAGSASTPRPGPTEIAILADATADPVHVAADLISQAEHDPLAAAVLVTDSVELADAVEKELEPQVAATKHIEDRIVPALAGRQSAIVLVDGVDEGLRVVDAYGAEHLEIQTADAAAVADRVRNAGAIFVGPWAPVSLGDYCAGSNHVLPTGGCACHSSGLSVQSFLRGIHIVDYTRDALAEVAHHVVTLAEAEDLPAHGAAIKARFGWKVPESK